MNFLNAKGINTIYSGAESAKAVAKKYKLTYEEINRYDRSAINKALDSGKVCILSIDSGVGPYVRRRSFYYV